MKRSFFWESIAQRYARSPVADEAAYQQKLKTTRNFMPADARVFEFGCGTGSTAISHAPYVKHIHAIDISANMIDIARTKAAAADVSNVVFETSTLDEFGAAPESFDVVLGLSILHLLADRNAAIAKVFTLLKPGGVFVSSTACIADTMAWIKYLAPIGRPLGMMLKIFSAEELRSSLKNAGFEIVHQWQKEDSPALFLVAVKPQPGELQHR